MKIIEGDIDLRGMHVKVLPDLRDIKVDGNFRCTDNRLTSLEGAPKEVGGNFWCAHNARKFTEEEIRAVCRVRGRVNA